MTPARLTRERLAEIRKWAKTDLGAHHPVHGLLAEIDALEGNLSCVGVHTCHEHCNNPMCLMRKERDSLKALADSRYQDLLKISEEAQLLIKRIEKLELVAKCARILEVKFRNGNIKCKAGAAERFHRLTDALAQLGRVDALDKDR